MSKLIKLHPTDNVLITVEEISMGEHLSGDLNMVKAASNVAIGHKIASQLIKSGDKIIKYGVSIGSATKDIEIGEHIHLHNMKSDYITTYTIEDRFKDNIH